MTIDKKMTVRDIRNWVATIEQYVDSLPDKARGSRDELWRTVLTGIAERKFASPAEAATAALMTEAFDLESFDFEAMDFHGRAS